MTACLVSSVCSLMTAFYSCLIMDPAMLSAFCVGSNFFDGCTLSKSMQERRSSLLHTTQLEFSHSNCLMLTNAVLTILAHVMTMRVGNASAWLQQYCLLGFPCTFVDAIAAHIYAFSSLYVALPLWHAIVVVAGIRCCCKYNVCLCSCA
jgi:hypothetical protein